MSRGPFIDQVGIYLLSHSVGLPLRSSQQAAADSFWQPWQAADSNIWTHWLAAIQEFRTQLAILLNGDTASFCPQTCLSTAVAKIVDSLAWQTSKNCILLSEQDFPSIAFALQKALGDRVALKFIAAGADTSDIHVWDQHMTEDVGLVLATHVQSNNGRQLPVAQITALSRDKGILSLVDIAQSVGILPIDLDSWCADFVVGSCVKWVGGGPGAAFMWLSPEIIEHCQPRSVGWFSHRDPFEFDIHHFSYQPDALRFWGGTPSVYPFALAAHSLAAINARGVESIRAHNLKLADQIIDKLSPEQLISPLDPALRSGTLIVDFADRQPQLSAVLQQHQVHFDSRAQGVRLSPHLCNTEEQIARLTGLF